MVDGDGADGMEKVGDRVGWIVAGEEWVGRERLRSYPEMCT